MVRYMQGNLVGSEVIDLELEAELFLRTAQGVSRTETAGAVPGDSALPSHQPSVLGNVREMPCCASGCLHYHFVSCFLKKHQ